MTQQRWPPKQAQWWINGQKDEGLRASPYPGDRRPLSGSHAAHLPRVRGGLQSPRRYRFRGVATAGARAVEATPRGAGALSAALSDIFLVDEFQDTNAVQYAWLRLLAGTRPVVSPRWATTTSPSMAGAAPKSRIFSATNAILRALTRLSSSKITAPLPIFSAAANAVIARNAERLGKNLWTDSGEGEPIALYAAFNEHDEARYIADRLHSWVQRGQSSAPTPPFSTAPTRSRECLRLPCCRPISPTAFTAASAFTSAWKLKTPSPYLRLMLNCHDDTAFRARR